MCAASNKKLSVLLIAKAPRAHQTILSILQQLGFNIIIATDGAAGYQKTQLMLPSLIMLDSTTSGIPPLSLIRMLRGLSATAGIPIIYLANDSCKEECISALQAGAIDSLPCPYQAEELLARIQIHISLSKGGVSEPEQKLTFNSPQNSGCSIGDQVLVHAADGVIQTHLNSPLTQKSLAIMLQVSERRLATAFVRSLGIRASEYIGQQRLKRAEHLISSTTLSLALIAEELGYSSPANFSTAFKKYKGISPRQFRKLPPTEA